MLLVLSPRKIAQFLSILVLAIGVCGTLADFVRQATQSWSHKGLAQLAWNSTPNYLSPPGIRPWQSSHVRLCWR